MRIPNHLKNKNTWTPDEIWELFELNQQVSRGMAYDLRYWRNEVEKYPDNRKAQDYAKQAKDVSTRIAMALKEPELFARWEQAKNTIDYMDVPPENSLSNIKQYDQGEHQKGREKHTTTKYWLDSMVDIYPAQFIWIKCNKCGVLMHRYWVIFNNLLNTTYVSER